ncbi:MAG: hypothetical protein QGH45_11935, partial [Myxococcota bacterium]|nr:hypothetical protein [Myxococcota bacterium]
ETETETETEPFQFTIPDLAAAQLRVARDPALQSCFRDHSPDHTSAINAAISVGPDGVVRSARIVGSAPASGDLTGCITAGLRAMQFGATSFDWTAEVSIRPRPDLDLPVGL